MNYERESKTPTPWAVRCFCSQLEPVYMTRECYIEQMSKPNAKWVCPRCGHEAVWDDSNYEIYYDQNK